eukprot:CAMPEP_0184371314 /NCGR_PEP_ID=MMETSP1089-20130417/163333_1 /TAXON_ID=38269 ORGANISM="Gloeochaete wittrockiana, Strain SAG46.84" /NCGR_SAMPLE_ID=MMETSP1089 /ASSEMBLY_ACC=CAM_ASM_000445 /LENGTH=627 /DNA_ID=CAMNT_0026714059 /DNA_START=477 /DNA_END=2360 /DNA_ORIENTATION=-
MTRTSDDAGSSGRAYEKAGKGRKAKLATLLPAPPAEASRDVGLTSPKKRPPSSDHSDDASVSPKRRGSVSPTHQLYIHDDRTAHDETAGNDRVSPRTPRTHLAPPPTTPGGSGGLRRSQSTEPIGSSELSPGDRVLPLPSASLAQKGRSPQRPRRKSADGGSPMQTSPKVRNSKKKPMTEQEIKERLFQRQMDNRESARKSRENKEREMETLNIQVTQLKSEITHLQEKVNNSSKVEQENEILKESLKQLSLYLEQHRGWCGGLPSPAPDLFLEDTSLVHSFPSASPPESQVFDLPHPNIRVLPAQAVVVPDVTNSAPPPPPPMGLPTLVAAVPFPTTLGEGDMTLLNDPFSLPSSPPGSLAASPLPQSFAATGHPFNNPTTAPATTFSDPPAALAPLWTSLPNPATTNLSSQEDPFSYRPTSVSLPNPTHNNNNNNTVSSTQPQYPTTAHLSPGSIRPSGGLSVFIDFTGPDWRPDEIIEITEILASSPCSNTYGHPPRPPQWGEVNDMLSFVDGAFSNNQKCSGALASNNGGGEGCGGGKRDYQTTNGNEGVLHATTRANEAPQDDFARTFSGLLNDVLLKESFLVKAEDHPFFNTGGGGGESSNPIAGGSPSTGNVPEKIYACM